MMRFLFDLCGFVLLFLLFKNIELEAKKIEEKNWRNFFEQKRKEKKNTHQIETYMNKILDYTLKST